GTRAYAVRDDLKTYNRRLLDYVKDGGNLIVLYNTQELVPNEFAPYPGVLTARAEEVSEEDSPVEILAPAHRVLTTPNTITAADFNGWVEQRGSKFWSEWDRAYTMGPRLHADHRDSRHRPAVAARWVAHRRVWQGALHVLRVRLPSPAAVRRPRRISAAGQLTVAGEMRTRRG
ncbi:MAG: hypothetical protein JF601_00760, partial [Acidobacteria bacterium]|nr:hypothetical protein [Acidobacteriota bacterium]